MKSKNSGIYRNLAKFLTLLFLLEGFLFVPPSLMVARAATTDGSVVSTVEINGPGDAYGSSVASIGDLDGDSVPDLAVGAYGDDTGGTDYGAVYNHFMNADGSVKSTAEINDNTPNGPALTESDFYGSAVASMGDLDGDSVPDLAVGAFQDDAGGTNRGAVHIHFMNADGSVKSTVEINSSTANGPVLADNDAYGHSIAPPGRPRRRQRARPGCRRNEGH